MPGPLPLVRIVWPGAVRFVSAEFPPIDAIESAGTPEDLAGGLELLEITGSLGAGTRAAYEALPATYRRAGPGAWAVLAPFVYPSSGRFSSPRRGALCVARTEPVAEVEWCCHRERLLRDRGLARASVVARRLAIDIDLSACDARDARATHPELYDRAPGGTDATRAIADGVAAAGIVYESLRREGGECLAVLRPDAVPGPVIELGKVRLAWSAADGWARR